MHHHMHSPHLSVRQRTIRALAAAAAPALLLGALTATPAAAASSAPACGSTLTTDTVLTSDLNCPTGAGLIIGANGITLNLAGHTLYGAIEIQGEAAPIEGTTIRNGTIADSAVGISLL